MGGFPLQLLHSLVFFIKIYITLLLSILIKLCLILCTISDPLFCDLSVIFILLPLILFSYVDFSFCPSDFLKQDSPLWRPNSYIQQYGLLHQLPFLWTVASGFLVGRTSSLLLRFLISPCSWLILFFIASMAESLVTILLAYSTI